jgi:mannose-6-phosphate isomerase-like protein (cupin superfamily)
MIRRMGYHVVKGGEHDFEERNPPPGREGDPARHATDVSTSASLQQSRAQLWRYPPGARGRRHAEHDQEEVFFVVSGMLTMHLGDPAERIDLEPLSVVCVQPGTPLQVRNEGDKEVVVFVYGAPPVRSGADFFEDATP